MTSAELSPHQPAQIMGESALFFYFNDLKLLTNKQKCSII